MANYKSMPEKFECGFFRIDLNGSYVVDWDEKFLSMIGYKTNEVGENLIMIDDLLNNEVSDFYENLKDARRNGKLFCQSAKIYKKQGNSLDVLLYTGMNNDYNSFIISNVTKYEDNVTQVRSMEEFISNIPGAVAAFTIDEGQINLQYANSEYYNILGYSKAEYDLIQGKSINNLIHKNDFKKLQNDYYNPDYDNSVINREMRINTRNRGFIWVSLKSKCNRYLDGKLLYFCVILDIDSHKKLEQELALQEEKFKLLAEITKDIPFEYNIATDIFVIPKKDFKDNPYVIRDVLNRNFLSKIILPEDMPVVSTAIMRMLEHKDKGMLEFRAKIFDDTYKWHRVYYINVLNEEGNIIKIVGKILNIDEEKCRQFTLEQRVQADPMTNLLNKVAIKFTIDNYLMSKVDEAVHAMLLIDIDNFKKVNDTLGHIMGDTAIQDIADCLKDVFRISDYLGRVGGDEFVIFMKNINKEAVRQKAAELCSEIYHTYKNKKGHVQVSCSVGIAYYPYDGNDYDELFSKADLAMYFSKLNGGNFAASYEEIIENIGEINGQN